MLLFFGSGQMRLNYSEFCSSLAGVGLVTAVHLFCCIVVFQYRRNMIVEASIERENNSTGIRPAGEYQYVDICFLLD